MSTRDVLAAAMPDVMDEATCLEVYGPGVDRLDMADEWYTSPREMADAIIANLDEAGYVIVSRDAANRIGEA